MRISDWSSYVCSSDLPCCQLEFLDSRPHRFLSSAAQRSERLSLCAFILLRLIQLRQPLGSCTTIAFIRIVNLAEIQPGSVLSLSPSSPAFFSLRSEEHTSELQSLMRI